MTAQSTTDPVMQLTRGAMTRVFSYEEWTCARLMYVSGQTQSRALELLFANDHGLLEEAAVRELRVWSCIVTDSLATRELRSSVAHGAHAAGGEFFALLKKTWKLPYRHITDSTDTIRVGSRGVGKYGAPESSSVPRFIDVPAFASALRMLRELAALESGPIDFETVGKRYLADRR